MTERRNDVGEPLGTARVQLKRAEYGTGECYGYFPEVRWEAYRQDCADDNGFDRRHREENGDYTMEVTLPKGTLLLRYGSETGHFTAPLHTPYETLGLPWLRETVEYHEYRVVVDGLRVLCLVKRGRVAPMFDSPGGGVQYLHPNSIRALIRRRVLVEVLRYGE